MKQIERTSELHLLPAHFYLFSFGANDEINLAKRLCGKINEAGTKKEIKIIRNHSSAAFLPGYLRSFFGYSKNWNGSVATLIRTNKRESGTYGLITEFTKNRAGEFFIGKIRASLKNLCKVENIDGGMYVLRQVTKMRNNVPVYAFIGCVNRFKNNILPSKAYLNAVGKTLHRSFPDAKEIQIPVRLGNKKKIICNYYYQPPDV